MNAILRQAGAVPYRYGADGLSVLLITSRGSGRWVIPKGRIEKGFTARQTAEREAFEEAGIKGLMSEKPLGNFKYDKRRGIGAKAAAIVEVYAMAVEIQLSHWPERAERRLCWMSVAEAVRSVREPGLAALLERLCQEEAAQTLDAQFRDGATVAGGLPRFTASLAAKRKRGILLASKGRGSRA